MKKYNLFLLLLTLLSLQVVGQDYFYKQYAPFEAGIPSPANFLGYKIGEQHTRHDQVVTYFEKLASLSDKVVLTEYGRTHENRKLLMLTVSSSKNIEKINQIKTKHLDIVNPTKTVLDYKELPVFINLGYNVHGNEPSGTEAALLTAYTLVASKHHTIQKYLDHAIIFIDPTINPDGRDRHTHWVNTRKSKNLVADPLDFEHTETWPSGRTNHYWFDLNRDWLLAVHPESQAKLKWFHDWYPNIVTDFHEMGAYRHSYFFEPEKISGSLQPLAPKENYEKLNPIFAKAYAKTLEELGVYYFTKELFDATYPGYGSTYADLQGSLALLFEQASSRGHLKKTVVGEISFPYTIRNHFYTTFSTINTAIENKDLLYDYQQNFFKNSLIEGRKSSVKNYIFGDAADPNRTKEFIKLLLHHQIEVYQSGESINIKGSNFSKETSYVIPVEQKQYKMIGVVFDTFKKYRDSVFYDASAWSVSNFYNMPFKALKRNIKHETKITRDNLYQKLKNIPKANYAYTVLWSDYNAPAFLYALQKAGVIVQSIQKDLNMTLKDRNSILPKGSLIIPVGFQKISQDSLYSVIKVASQTNRIPVSTINSGDTGTGISLNGRNTVILQKPKVLMWVGGGVSAYEAGEVWHLLDTRVNIPLSKVALRNFNRVDFNNYNTMVMVSGSYVSLDSIKKNKIKAWIAQGNTLITSREASAWVVKNKIVKEELMIPKKDSLKWERKNYEDRNEISGREQIGGAIFEIDLDLTHPIGYGYTRRKVPVYRNSTVWLKPSKNPYTNVAMYSDTSPIDGFISPKNLDILSQSVSILVSPVGRGRVVLFADNPNFRGAWYGTNKLFLNAIFFGNSISLHSGVYH